MRKNSILLAALFSVTLIFGVASLTDTSASTIKNGEVTTMDNGGGASWGTH